TEARTFCERTSSKASSGCACRSSMMNQDLFQDFLPAHPLLSIALAVAGKHRGEVPGQCETARPRKLEHRSGPTWHLSRPSMASVAVGNPGHRHDCNFHYTY